jgi:hypothetical protein
MFQKPSASSTRKLLIQGQEKVTIGACQNQMVHEQARKAADCFARRDQGAEVTGKSRLTGTQLAV